MAYFGTYVSELLTACGRWLPLLPDTKQIPGSRFLKLNIVLGPVLVFSRFLLIGLFAFLVLSVLTGGVEFPNRTLSNQNLAVKQNNVFSRYFNSLQIAYLL